MRGIVGSGSGSGSSGGTIGCVGQSIPTDFASRHEGTGGRGC